MKKCSVCGLWKELDEFYNRHDLGDGKQSYCKSCSAAINKEHSNRMKGFGNWNPLKLIDDRRFDMNLVAMGIYNQHGWVNTYDVRSEWGV